MMLDFKAKKMATPHVVESLGHILVLLPKFTPHLGGGRAFLGKVR